MSNDINLLINKLMIVIPKRYHSNIFWCPKVIDGKNGVILYIYGGCALKLYINVNEKIGVKIFDKRYLKYIEKSLHDKIWKEFKDANRRKTGIDIILSWNASIWESICKAFYEWATKGSNSEYERMRQTRICHDNMTNDEFNIFTMEEKFKSTDNKPEVDMIAMRETEEGVVFSYVEYKCTESATKGKLSIPEHYRDMTKLTCSQYNTQRLIKLFEQRKMIISSGNDISDNIRISTDFVIMLSNICEKNQLKEETGKKVTAQTVYSQLKKTMKRKDFKEENVKIIILDDIDITSKQTYQIKKEDLLTFSEAMDQIKKRYSVI